MKSRMLIRHCLCVLMLVIMAFAVPLVLVRAEGIYYSGDMPEVGSSGEEPSTEYIAEQPVETALFYRVKQAGEWSDYQSKGSTASKVESSKSITNIDVSITSGYTGVVCFGTYTENGWSEYTRSGETKTTYGKIQAIRMKLTDQLAERYDIYYRVHMTDGKWLDWASNGGKAGSIDLKQRINAIHVKLVAKGGKAPGNTKKPYVMKPDIVYKAALAGKKLSESKDKSWGQTSGSTKNKTAITGIKMKLSNLQIPGGMEYRVVAEGEKFGDWVSAGKLAGHEKSDKTLARLQIRLTGQLAKAYDIYYRVKIKRYGWLDWTKNGKTAGSTGLDLPITAYQVKLVKKAEKVSWDTENSYLVSNEQEYVIKVNKQMNCITVYLNDKPIKAFVCSTGEATPTGTFYTMVRYRWKELIHEVWGQYCTRIVGHILFHSVPYHEANNKTLLTGSFRKLGTTASAGCIRLTCRDAKWIYDNCKLKTKVVIYKSNDPGPLGKPKAPYLPAGQKWDPTDPAFTKK